MKLRVLVDLLKIFGNSNSSSTENSLALSVDNNAIMEREITFNRNSEERHDEIAHSLENIEISQDEVVNLINYMETENADLSAYFQKEVIKFEESPLGIQYAEIVECYKGRELNSEKILYYIEKMNQIDESDVLVEELKVILELIKNDEEKSFWHKLFEPSTSGFIRATKPVIEGFVNAFKMLSENHAVRKIVKELFTHLGEEGLQAAREMVQSSQSSSSPEEMTDLMRRMQEFYDHCKNQ